jgi:hypothetical protein
VLRGARSPHGRCRLRRVARPCRARRPRRGGVQPRDDARAPRRSRERFADALHAFAALNDGGGIADSLDGLGRIAATVGDATRAGRLLGVAERLRETRGRRPIRADLPLPEVPATARDEGRAIALEDALAYALGIGA